jgi:N-carbamoylputrescine amidase
MRLGLIQTTHTTGGDLPTVIERIREAAGRGAQVICLQELFNAPYFCRVQDTAFFELAEPIPGPTTNALREVARELGVVLIAPLFERRAAGIYHNSAAFIDADGALLGVYRKKHIPQDPGFEEKFYFTPGDGGYPAYRTRFGTVGLLICWDQWYPEAARLAALNGAEVLLYPTAIGWLPEEKDALGVAQHHAWQTVQCGHAVANGCFVAAVNRVGLEGQETKVGSPVEFWGRSFVADPYGQLIAEAPSGEEAVVVVECDLAAVEAFRRIWPFFRDRRIDTYTKILERFGDGGAPA